MSAVDHSGHIANETAREQRYSDGVGDRARGRQRLANENVNNTWTTPVDESGPRNGEFVGRVGFSGAQALIDGATDFYVGTAKFEGEGYVVYNWTAPIAACTYYRQPAKTPTLTALSESAAAVRVFGRSGGRISDFEDEILSESGEDFFPIEALRVPRAPGRAAPVPAAPEEPSTALVDPADSPDSANSEAPDSSLRPSPVLVPSTLPNVGAIISTKPTSPPGPPIRTPELLRRQLAAPKAISMAAVLSTLQTDQYKVIARPASQTQFLQGHPGTGKTIIAAHRAAFMLNGEVPAEDRPRGEILILGPTDEYVTHISAALSRLIDRPERYAVRSIPSMMDEFASVPPSAAPTHSLIYSDVSPDLALLVDKAFARARNETEGDLRPTRESVYVALLNFLRDPPQGVLDAEWATYLRDPQLPRSYGELKRLRLRRYRGLMAYIGILVDGRRQQIGHIIVDEAQDVHPIEWEILGRLGNTGGWTILGDLNQRRTDHTYSSWDAVALALALEDESNRAPVTVLDRGYRSTSQIIRFANQLLRSEDRLLYSLQQDGEDPRVRKVPSKGGLIQAAFEEAEGLSDRVGRGTTAVIGMDTEAFRRLLLTRGWKADPSEPSTWIHEHRSLRLLPPERARGLEFDGVVVIEPAEFPENVGRLGVLYTALTRANRYLTVVYNRALPGRMKARP